MLGDIRYTHVRGICINDRGTSAALMGGDATTINVSI